MTPYEIGILLHYYTTPGEPPPCIDRSAALWRGTIDCLTFNGLINYGGRLTEKGRMYVEQGLCKVPLPVNEWRIPWEKAGE